MKFSEDILREFDLEPPIVNEPVNMMQIEEMLQFLKVCAERIVMKSRLYKTTSEADIRTDCIDIVTVKLNDFTQAFKDLVIFMRKEEGTYTNGTSLRYCISSFDTFGFQLTNQANMFLRELLLRNEIIHDYFNREIHQQKLIWIMENCSAGALEVYMNISEYCAEKKLLNKLVDKK